MNEYIYIGNKFAPFAHKGKVSHIESDNTRTSRRENSVTAVK